MTFANEMIVKKLDAATVKDLKEFRAALRNVTTLDAEVFNVIDGNSFLELIKLSSDISKIIRKKKMEEPF